MSNGYELDITLLDFYYYFPNSHYFPSKRNDLTYNVDLRCYVCGLRCTLPPIVHPIIVGIWANHVFPTTMWEPRGLPLGYRC
jgi:hypothetical protein